MHCVHLGVVKKLFTLWFELGEEGSIRHFVDFINRMLILLKPPVFVTRLPRYITDFLYWKAHELRNFLLYYSVPIFSIAMLQDQFEHHKLLVSGIILLSSQRISEEMIAIAEMSLNKYVLDFSKFYGKQHMTCFCFTSPTMLENSVL